MYASHLILINLEECFSGDLTDYRYLDNFNDGEELLNQPEVLDDDMTSECSNNEGHLTGMY